MSNKDIIKMLNEALESLNKLDTLITIDGYNDLWAAKQQLVILRTILTIEERMDEDTPDE